MPPPPGSPGAPITPRALPPFPLVERTPTAAPMTAAPMRPRKGDQWSPRQKYGRPADFVPPSKQLHNRHRKPGNAPKHKNGVMPGEPGITPLYQTAGRSAPTAPPEGKSGISFSEDCRFRSSRSSSRDAPRGAFRRRSPRHGRCPPSGSRRPPRGGSPNRRVSRG